MLINEIAVRTGFTASTLRYYEAIGLLPASKRTPAGYRTYDERSVERLSFIARAKQLGCTLDEIGDLTVAWDGGRCGPIQDRLRVVVASKLAAAGDQIAETESLARDLRRAATSLELHRPDGVCDDACGCLGEPAAAPDSASGESTPSAPAERDPPIACTLRPAALHGQLDDWERMLGHATRRLPLPGGVRVELDADTPVTGLAGLVAAEQECCRFFSFAITIDTRGLGLEVTGPDDAAVVIEALFGTAA